MSESTSEAITLSNDFREAVRLGRAEALSLGAERVESAHLLLGMLRDDSSRGGDILKETASDPSALWNRLEQTGTGEVPLESTPDQKSGLMPVSAEVESALKLSVLVAGRLGRQQVGSDDLLLAIAGLEDGSLVDLLAEAGITVEDIRARMPDAPEHDA